MKQILATVIIQGFNQEVTFCQKPISCEDGARALGLEWFVPVVESGILRGYRNVVHSTKPQADAIKTIRVQQGGQTLYLAIPDDGTLANFADACNLCCENGTPTLTAPEFVEPFIEDEVCADDEGNYTYLAHIPEILDGQRLYLQIVTCNMEALATPPAEGFADEAALLAWVNDNLDETAGEFTIEESEEGNNFLKLVSPDCASAYLSISLLPQAWCADVTFPVEYDTITHNEVVTTLDASKTAATAADLIGQIASYFADGTLTNPASGKIEYNGTGVPATLKLGVTTKATFTEGECVPATTTAAATTTAP